MSNLKDENRQKALALAALERGITAVPYGYPETRWRGLDLSRPVIDFLHGKQRDDKATPIEALAAAAEALGLEPDPILQQQEQTAASPPVHITVKGQSGDTVTVHVTEAECGLRLQATGDGESSAECVSATGDVQWTSAGMVPVPAAVLRELADSIEGASEDVDALASDLKARRYYRNDADDTMHGIFNGLSEAAHALTELLAPKESTPEPQEGALPRKELQVNDE